MKHNWIYSLLIFMLFTANISAQQMADGCGVQSINELSISEAPWVGNNAYLDRYLQQINYSPIKQNFFYHVPIQFWVYTDDLGNTKTTPETIKNYLQELNQYNKMNNTGLYYYSLPKIRYIPNPKYLNIRWHGEALHVTNKYKNESAINVHIVHDISRHKFLFFGHTTANYRGLYNSFTKGIVIRVNSSATTFAHEVGHFFGLTHTHNNSNTKQKDQEAVNRNRTQAYKGKVVRNCEINGDGLCDTPADPNISWHVNDDCRYTGTHLHDNWGDIYKPDPSNIMAYPRFRKCRNTFSKHQIAIMLYTAAKHPYAKKWTIKEHSILTDRHEPNPTPEYATELKAHKKQHHSLHPTVQGVDKDIFQITLTKKSNVRFEIESKNPIIFKKINGKTIALSKKVRLKKGTHYFKVHTTEKNGTYYTISAHFD